MTGTFSAQELAILEDVAHGRRGLPGPFFTDPRLYALEMRDIFQASWVCVAASDDLPSPKSVYPVTFGDQPILLARDRNNTLKAFFNVCSHRGAVMLDKPQKSCTRIVCPYHAWSYDLDGTLRATPHVGGYNVHQTPEIDPAKLGLRPIPVREWAGLVFVNISGDGKPFDDFIRPMADRLAAYDLSLLRLGIETGVEFKANWKIVVENFVESYHLPWIHAHMNSYNPMEDHYQIIGGENFLGQGLKNMRPNDAAAYKLPRFPNLTADQLTIGESYYLYPNVMFGLLIDYLYAIILFPVSPDVTRERLVILFNGEEAARSPAYADLRQVVLDRMVEVNNEDIFITERLQAGRYANAFTGGQFAPAQEKTSLCFQQAIALRLLRASGRDVAVTLPMEDIHHAVETA